LRRRETGLLVFALAIVGASLLTETRRDVGAAAPEAGLGAARDSQTPRQRGEVAVLDVNEWLQRLKARGMNSQPSGPGLFGGTNWQPAPDPASSQPVKPQTPPFPFVLLGRMTLGDSTVIVVAKGDASFTAKVGQVIEQFRIDRIDDDSLRVTYVPNGESRDYKYEQLYVAASAAPLPGSPMQGMQATQPAMQEAAEPTDLQLRQALQSAQTQQQAPSAPAAAEKPAAASPGIAGAAGAAAAGAVQVDPKVQGAASPIGGMVIMPTPPGSGMLITPTPPGNNMVMTPTPAGAGMTLTQPAAGSVMQSTPAPASQ
jgi:hypothetical protein